MSMTILWTFSLILAILFGSATGNAPDVGNAVMVGTSSAVNLCISIGGIICLWSGILEVMKVSGISDNISTFFLPILSKIFPSVNKYPLLLEKISQNVSANLLGLGNAATPAGLKATKIFTKIYSNESASDELCRFVILNTASIQLIPATVAAVRAAAGAENAFDILPAVWISSITAVAAGLICSQVLRRFFK